MFVNALTNLRIQVWFHCFESVWLRPIPLEAYEAIVTALSIHRCWKVVPYFNFSKLASLGPLHNFDRQAPTYQTVIKGLICCPSVSLSLSLSLSQLSHRDIVSDPHGIDLAYIAYNNRYVYRIIQYDIPIIACRGGQHIFFKQPREGKLKNISGPGEGKSFFFWKLPKSSPVPITKYPTVPN